MKYEQRCSGCNWLESEGHSKDCVYVPSDHIRRERDAIERERIRLAGGGEFDRMTAYRAEKEKEALDWPERYERLERELAATKADLRRFEEGYWCRGDPDELHYCTKCDNSVRPERYPIAYRCPHGTDTVHGHGCDACAAEYERANATALAKAQGSA